MQVFVRHLLIAAAAALSLSLAGATLRAQAPPAIKRIEPIGLKPGDTTRITFTGSNLTGQLRLWTSPGAETPLASGVDKNGEQSDRAVFDCALPPETPPGLHALRILGPAGVSSLRLWLADDLTTVPLAGDNLSREAAQPVPVPCAVDGLIGNLQRRYLRFDAAAGQHVTFNLFARRLGSELDPVITLFGPDGREIASADDTPGFAGDCQLHCELPAAGAYVLELRDIRYRGGEDYFFRLRMGEFPCVQTTYPLAVTRGASTSVELVAADSDPVKTDVAVPADWPHDWYAAAAGSPAAFASLIVSDRPELLEQEPNDELAAATPFTAEQNLNGRIDRPGDVDRYRITVEKGTRLIFDGLTRAAGAPTDLMLRLLSGDGKPIASKDDDGVTEARIDHTFAEAGEYLLEVTDLIHRGGPQFVYRIEVIPGRPAFQLAVDGDALNVPQGGTAVVPVRAIRSGYNGEIALAIEGLPAGAAATPSTIGTGQTLGHVSLSWPADAEPLHPTPVTIVGSAKIGDSEVRAVAQATDWLRGQWRQLAVVPRAARHAFMAAGAAPARMALSVEPAEVVFGRDLKAALTVRVKREAGLDGEIKLATVPEKDALPKEIALEIKPIPAGADSVTLNFSATGKAPLGRYSVILTGSTKKGDENLSASTPVINFRLAAPYTLAVAPTEAPLHPGGELALNVRIERNPAFSGPVKLSLEGLPAGVTLAETTIAADQSEAQLRLVATAETAKGEIKGAKLHGKAGDGDKLTAETALPTVTIE